MGMEGLTQGITWSEKKTKFRILEKYQQRRRNRQRKVPLEETEKELSKK